MKLKKETISHINETTAMLLKGGTRGSETSAIDDSALISHCGDIQCY
ncbi:hypothetical protein [Kordia sp.]|nr:hypothetical protein [Kordia sp.]MCH2193360.1 hypothetical protein [Kordia sp.]